MLIYVYFTFGTAAWNNRFWTSDPTPTLWKVTIILRILGLFWSLDGERLILNPFLLYATNSSIEIVVLDYCKVNNWL